MHSWIRNAGLVLLLGACAEDAPGPGEDAPAAPEVPAAEAPIDAAIPPAIAGADGWDYQQVATADLDGDGVEERIVLTARVEMIRGRPAWDDGQAWQVYVESAAGQRTYVYAQRLQLGALTMRIGLGTPTTVVMLEHLPDQMRLFEATWRGPDVREVHLRFTRPLDPRGEIASPRYP
jgi:hypothetical protein